MSRWRGATDSVVPEKPLILLAPDPRLAQWQSASLIRKRPDVRFIGWGHGNLQKVQPEDGLAWAWIQMVLRTLRPVR